MKDRMVGTSATAAGRIAMGSMVTKVPSGSVW
jgi:hypothetical protein